MIEIDDNDHLGMEEQVDLCQAERTTNVLHSWSPEDHHRGVDDHYHDHDKNYRENILVVNITIITVINITDMVTYSYSSLWNDNDEDNWQHCPAYHCHHPITPKNYDLWIFLTTWRRWWWWWWWRQPPEGEAEYLEVCCSVLRSRTSFHNRGELCRSTRRHWWEYKEKQQLW